MYTFIICLSWASFATAVPLPTSDQLKWSQWELGAIIHFNMATYQGCGGSSVPAASLFKPMKLNTSQWTDAFQAFGAKYAVLTAKHGCGFTLWPSQVAFPQFGFKYNYTVQYSGVPSVDIIKDFVDSCHKAEIAPGFYYSVVSNFFLNAESGKVGGGPLKPGMVKVDQEQFEMIVLAQLKELWGNYGQLGEVWFDGGYQQDIKANYSALLNGLQPHATGFNGFGVSNNPIRWIGTEAGQAPDPTWSTGTSNGGDANSTDWCPAECDTTLQEQDRWFFQQGQPIRTLKELTDVYHATVGHNGNLLLDFTPDKDGLIPEDHMQRYKEFGDFIRSCYGSSVNSTKGQGNTVTLHFDKPATIDRFVIQEDQSQGQRIRSYTVSVQTTTGSEENVAKGTSVGNKKIDLLGQPMQNVTMATLSISQSTSPPIISQFGAYLCSH